MLPAGFELGPMNRAEVGTLGHWAAAEGWNPGQHDLDVAWAVDPQAFVALRREGELVGGGSVMAHGPGFGFMGLFIMRADLRGAGLGAQLWHHRLQRLRARLAPQATIGMDGVFDMVPFYQRGGFEFAFRDLRFEGTAQGETDPSLEPLSAFSFDEVCAFEARHSVAPRAEFLRRWISQPGVVALGAREQGRLVGLGVLRPALKGFKIGPLLADREDLARRLAASLMAGISGQPVQWDVPEPNAAGLALASDFGLRESFGCARLYHGPMPTLPVAQTWGVTSFEFG